MNTTINESSAPSSPTCFFATSPGHLHAVAHLYGVSGVRPDAARVLELGCGAGGNLLPFAVAYPNAKAVGVDIWPDLIEDGQRAIQNIGVSNLKLIAAPFTAVDDSYGEFDYIIVHDIYTWSPRYIQEAIWRICRDNLAPQGIAYISHNTYPGWKAGDILRDAMQLHTHAAASMDEALAGASAMLTLMSDGLSSGNPLKVELRAAVKWLQQCPDYYIHSDFLQATTAASYFVEFASVAAEAGLAYLGDALPQDELSSTYGANVQLNHSLIAMGQPKVMRQQYLDFAIGRGYRRSLFIRQDRTDGILNAPDVSRFAELRWASNFQRVNDPRKDMIDTAIFMNQKGMRLDLDDPYAIQILSVLDDAWPATLSYENLVFHTQYVDVQCLDKQIQAQKVQHALESLFKTGALRFSLGPGPYDQRRDTYIQFIPGMEPLSKPRQQYKFNTFNLWHDHLTLALNEKQRDLLPLFYNALALDVHYVRKVDEAISNTLIPLINILKRQGLLVAHPEVWLAYYSAVLRKGIGTYEQLVSAIGPLYIYGNTALYGGVAQVECNGVLTGPKKGFRNNIKTAPPEHTRKILQLRNAGSLPEARKLADRLTASFPDYFFSWELASMLASDENRCEDAWKYILKAIALQPNASRPYSHASVALDLLTKYADAKTNAARALNLDPNNEDGWNNMGNHFRSRTLPVQALACYKEMVRVAPKSVLAYTNLASTVGDLGHIEEAVEWNEKALHVQPRNFLLYSNQLYTLSQLSGIDGESFFEAHKEYGRRVKATVQKAPKLAHANTKEPNRRLRIGFVSGDLRNHAVANFIEPIWTSLDKTVFEIYAYHASVQEDHVSRRLEAKVTKWTNVASMNDEALAKRINADTIDILFDLSGHTAKNRLPMFARKPAPIQASWIGYPATTGLDTMDYYLSDKNFVPAGPLEEQFTEKLIWLPVSAAFEPFGASPDVNPLPALENGYFTFGSFNRISKVNEQVYQLWSRILHKVPTSKFLLANVYDGIRKDIVENFLRHGIEEHRLILCDRTDMRKYLALHHKVDLLLDTHPYSGGTTTAHALWMGVPTITLSGAIVPSRTTTAFLASLNIEGFSTLTPDDYVNTASKWTTQLSDLANIRCKLRGDMMQQTSNNQIAKHFELAMHHIWKRWCNDLKPESLNTEQFK